MAHGKEKKRKRAEDGALRPKKKVAIQDSSSSQQLQSQPPSQSSTIRVASIQKAKKCPPIIGIKPLRLCCCCTRSKTMETESQLLMRGIATSPGLCIPSSVQFNTYTKQQTSTSKRSKKSFSSCSSSSELLLHSSSHPKLDYTAKEDGPGGRESHLKHYIGVFDPNTGQLSVIEAKKMAVRGVVRTQQPPEESMEERTASKVIQPKNIGHLYGLPDF